MSSTTDTETADAFERLANLTPKKSFRTIRLKLLYIVIKNTICRALAIAMPRRIHNIPRNTGFIQEKLVEIPRDVICFDWRPVELVSYADIRCCGGT